MKQWLRRYGLLLSCALALLILSPVLFAAIFAPFKSESGTLTWQYFCFVLRSEWPAICALLVGVEGILFSVHFLRAPKHPSFPDSKTKKSIALVFLILQCLLLLGIVVVPYMIDEITPSHGLSHLLSSFEMYFLIFLCFSPVLIALEALVFFASFILSPRKKNRCLRAFHIVNAILAIVIFAIAMMDLDFSTFFVNWVPASVILILWIIEFAMRRNLKKQKATA